MTAALPAAVLLDMDGLLVDTERIWFEVESAIVSDLGGAWTDEDHDLLVGGPLERAVAHMLATTPAEADTADVTARLLSEMVAALRRGPVEWMPGAKLLLAALADAGVPTALVSSSRRPIVDAVLDAIGREAFQVTVSGDDVTRTKPSPDPYLLRGGSARGGRRSVRGRGGLDHRGDVGPGRGLRDGPGAARCPTCRPRWWGGGAPVLRLVDRARPAGDLRPGRVSQPVGGGRPRRARCLGGRRRGTSRRTRRSGRLRAGAG